MWELSCLCNLNSASVCISTKIKSPMISHTILCRTSVHRRDCGEFLLTAFLRWCSASRSCLSHASEILFRRWNLFTRFSSQTSQQQRPTASWAFIVVFLYHPLCEEHGLSLCPFCTWGTEVIKVKDILYFGVPILRPPDTMLSRWPLPPTSVTAVSTECSCISGTGIKSASENETQIISVLRTGEMGSCRKETA